MHGFRHVADVARGASIQTLAVGSLVVALILSIGAPSAMAASTWRPDKAVEFIVPSGPGGGNDRIVRTANQLMQQLKLVDVQSAVLNKPGGGQSVSYAYLSQHAGDGHFLGAATLNLLTNRITGTNPLGYRDVTPIVQLARYYLSFAVRADSPIKSFKDVVARLKADPASVSFSSAGGAFASITINLVGSASGVDASKLKTVVFRSGGEAMTALLGGHVDIVAAAPSGIVPHLKAGTARVIGVTAPKRLGTDFSDVPTLTEQGVNVVSANWYNVIGPPGLSASQVAYGEDVFGQLTASAEWKRELQRDIWEDSFLKSRDLLRSLQEQEGQIADVLRAMGLAKH